MTVAKIRASFDAALRKTTGKGFDHKAAIAMYEDGFRSVLENPAIVVADLEAPRWLTDAYIGYAIALTGEKRPDDAREAYRSQIRSFPELRVTSAVHGPDAADLYEAVRRELDAAPRGTLLVSVNRPDAVVAINHVGRGRGDSVQTRTVAGRYPVLVQVGAKALRYIIEASPATREHEELQIDWDLDSRLAVTDRWVGLQSATEGSIPALGKKFPRNGLLALSIIERGGVRWLVGTRYQAHDGLQLMRCATQLMPGAEKLLAECLIHGRYEPGVTRELPARDTEEREAPSTTSVWAGVGIAAAAISVGGYYAARHGTCVEYEMTTWACNEERDTRLHAGVSLAIGGIALAYTTVSYLRYSRARQRQKRRPIVGLSVENGGGMLSVSGVF